MNLPAVVDRFADDVSAALLDTDPPRGGLFVYRYVQHRGLTPERVPALEVYPAETSYRTVSTDTVLEHNSEVIVAYSEDASYGAETMKHTHDEAVAKAALDRAAVVSEVISGYVGGFTIPDSLVTYLAIPLRVSYDLPDGLVWRAEFSLTVEALV